MTERLERRKMVLFFLLLKDCLSAPRLEPKKIGDLQMGRVSILCGDV